MIKWKKRQKRVNRRSVGERGKDSCVAINQNTRGKRNKTKKSHQIKEEKRIGRNKGKNRNNNFVSCNQENENRIGEENLLRKETLKGNLLIKPVHG